MCHCAENRQMIAAALRGDRVAVAVAAQVASNMAQDARTVAAQAAGVVRGRIAAARARLAR